MVLLFGKSLARAKRLKPLPLLMFILMAQLLPLSGVAALSGGQAQKSPAGQGRASAVNRSGGLLLFLLFVVDCVTR